MVLCHGTPIHDSIGYFSYHRTPSNYSKISVRSTKRASEQRRQNEEKLIKKVKIGFRTPSGRLRTPCEPQNGPGAPPGAILGDFWLILGVRGGGAFSTKIAPKREKNASKMSFFSASSGRGDFCATGSVFVRFGDPNGSKKQRFSSPRQKERDF